MSSDDDRTSDGPAGEGRRTSRRRVDLEVDASLARGAYANMALISHTPNEFVLDFALAAPGRRPTLTARVITSPAHAKALLRSLADNVRRYEARHGAIAEPPLATRSSDGGPDEHN